MTRAKEEGAFPDVSLPELMRQTARKFATRTAMTFGGKALDFAHAGEIGDRVAAVLAARGIRKGDRVGVYSTNSDAFALAYCGIVKAGAVVVPVNILLNPREAAFVLADSGARALFYAEPLGEAVAAIRASLPDLSTYICLGRSPSSGGDLLWEDVLAAAGPPPDLRFDPSEDLAAILYTSGTTGRPKGAMLTHRNLLANTFSIRQALHLEPGKDVILVVLPMFHSFAATVGMLFPLLHGCSFVPLPRFEPEAVARAVEETKTTIFLGVPSMFATLLRLREEQVEKLRSLRFCVSGGAALPAEIQEKFEARFGKLIYEGDGPTECSPVTCVNPVGGRRKRGSVGLPVPAVEMKIVDNDGVELPRGKTGEICVRGPNVMRGYWNLPEETRESFFGEWFCTGDLGYQDEEGYFFIVDRKKDMIIVNGMNLYPRIVEEVLYRFPKVREAAVVGAPHKLHGEIPVAYIALKDGEESTPEEIRDFCRKHLGSYEIPRKVFFLAELPKTASGKVLKREISRLGEFERGVDIT